MNLLIPIKPKIKWKHSIFKSDAMQHCCWSYGFCKTETFQNQPSIKRKNINRGGGVTQHHMKQPSHVQLVYTVKTGLYSTDVQGYIHVSPRHVSDMNISLHAIFIDRKHHIQQMDIHQRKTPTDTLKRSETLTGPSVKDSIKSKLVNKAVMLNKSTQM